MNIRFYKSRVIAFSIGAIAFSSVQAAPHAFPGQADQFAREVINVLVDEGVCRDINECARNRWVYRGGSDAHRLARIYSIHMLSPRAIQRVLQLALQTYYGNERKVTIEILGYKESKEQKDGIVFGMKPVVHLLLKRDE